LARKKWVGVVSLLIDVLGEKQTQAMLVVLESRSPEALSLNLKKTWANKRRNKLGETSTADAKKD